MAKALSIQLTAAAVVTAFYFVAQNGNFFGKAAPSSWDPRASRLGLPNGQSPQFFLKGIGRGNQLHFLAEGDGRNWVGENPVPALFPGEIAKVDAAALASDPNTRFFLITLRDGRLFGVIPGKKGQRPVGGPFINVDGIRTSSR